MIAVLVDIGNSQSRFARIPLAEPDGRPGVEAEEVRRGLASELAIGLRSLRHSVHGKVAGYVAIPTDAVNASRLDAICQQLDAEEATWVISSVHRSACQLLKNWLLARGMSPQPQFLSREDFPILVQVDAPDRVGTDRLAAVFAAGAMKPPDHSAIVVDVGTAVTIDAIGYQGAFLGGVILPGMELASRALALGTSQLPSLPRPVTPLNHSIIGQNTEQAIANGIFWGCVGAIAWIVTQMQKEMKSETALFLTGGGSEAVAPHLPFPFKLEPDLVMVGMALAVLP